MKAALKFGLTALGLFLIALGIGGMVVYTQAEKFASRSLSEILTESFAADARVEKISIAPTQKALILHNFELKNPSGFKEGDAFTSRRVILRMDPFSMLSRTPVIEATFLDSEVHYRYELAEGTNIGSLARRLENFSEVDPTPVKFVVNNVRCRDAKVTISTNLLPKAEMDLDLMTVELNDLNGRKPVTASKGVSIFLKGIMRETMTLNGLLDPIVDILRKESKDPLENKVQEDLDREKERESN